MVLKKDIDYGKIYPAPARIKTGSYTGDGATSLAITGIDFTPKIVDVKET